MAVQEAAEDSGVKTNLAVDSAATLSNITLPTAKPPAVLRYYFMHPAISPSPAPAVPTPEPASFSAISTEANEVKSNHFYAV